MRPDLFLGIHGPEVGNFQRFLNMRGAFLTVDEAFGPMTERAVKEWQIAENIPEKAGVVSALSRKRAQEQGFIPFIRARNYTPVLTDLNQKPREIELIVIHTMEAPDKPHTAENVALWFAGSSAPKASAHYCVCSEETVQCVRDRDVAWHANQANHNGIGIEHAGYARQTAEEWMSEFNQKMLLRSAKLVARLCVEYTIPIVKLTPDDLKSKLSGICGHIDVNNAFAGGKGHVDPGQNFPWQQYLHLVQDNLVDA